MTIPFGPLRLQISIARAPERRVGWEELAAVELDDHELARLNQLNTRDPVAATWRGWKLHVLGRSRL